jgi:DNA-binding transcriptional MerR regulator
MPDDALLTLRQLAQELGLPESTARYYRDAFLDHVPSVGTGRRRRYPREALAVLRQVARSYGAGLSRAAIAESLRLRDGGRAADVTVSEIRAGQTLEEVSNLDLLAAILDGEREQRDALWQMAKEIVRITEVLESQDHVLGEIAARAGVAVDERPALAGRRATALGAGAAPVGAASAFEPGTRGPAATSPAAEPAGVGASAPFTSAVPEELARGAAAPPGPAPAHQSQPQPRARPAAVEPPAGPVTVATGATVAPGPPPAGDPLYSTSPFDTTPAPQPFSAPAASPRAVERAAGAPRGAVPYGNGASATDIERLKAELEAERALVERLREAKLQLEHRTADAEAALAEARPRRGSVIRRLLKADER